MSIGRHERLLERASPDDIRPLDLAATGLMDQVRAEARFAGYTTFAEPHNVELVNRDASQLTLERPAPGVTVVSTMKPEAATAEGFIGIVQSYRFGLNEPEPTLGTARRIYRRGPVRASYDAKEDQPIGSRELRVYDCLDLGNILHDLIEGARPRSRASRFLGRLADRVIGPMPVLKHE